MWPFSEMSLSAATLVGTIANWVLLCCLLGGVLATFVIVKTTDVKEEHWDEARKHSAERIIELSTKGDEARAAIANANVELGRANEAIAVATANAATANMEAARLRLELDREIQKRAQRLLTDEQRSAIREGLAGMKEIAVVVQHDLEAEAFALQIMTSFPEGLRIYGPKPPGEDKWFAPAGLLMYSPAGQTEKELKDDPLYRTLKAANLFGGITGQPFLSPNARGPMLPPVIQGYTGHVLYVGQKSPF
jgi:hypothetical protein